jgi:hemolysin III
MALFDEAETVAHLHKDQRAPEITKVLRLPSGDAVIMGTQELPHDKRSAHKRPEHHGELIMSTRLQETATTARYTPGEEIANSVTHGFGIVLAIAGLTVLTTNAARNGNVWHMVSGIIFATTMILQYTFSTLYHSIQLPQAKRVLRVFDHLSIFLLIAGTYTPFMLVSLRGPWGWSLLGLVWGLALFGVAFQPTLLKRRPGLGVALYVGMGWVVVIAVKPMLAAVATGGLWLLLFGGLAYTLGVVFYLWKELPYHHAIWHGFVLAGSALHYFAVFLYVMPHPGV